MLADVDILQQIIPMEGWIRENLTVTDATTNQQFRFGIRGPQVKGANEGVFLIKPNLGGT